MLSEKIRVLMTVAEEDRHSLTELTDSVLSLRKQLFTRTKRIHNLLSQLTPECTENRELLGEILRERTATINILRKGILAQEAND